jgi:hypothetical protein
VDDAGVTTEWYAPPSSPRSTCVSLANAEALESRPELPTIEAYA